MFAYPCLTTANKFSALFSTISNYEVPTKFTYRYLVKIGFPSSRDRDLLPFLKQFQFIDAAGRPTTAYALIKERNSLKEYLAGSVASVYKDLLEHDTKLPNVPTDQIAAYFGTLTGASLSDCLSMAKTFTEVCSYSGFARTAQSPVTTVPKPSGPQISLSLEIPATTDERVYDSLFRHLKDLLNP